MLIFTLYALTNLEISVTETIVVDSKFELQNEVNILEKVDIDANLFVKMKSGIGFKGEAKERGDSLHISGNLELNGMPLGKIEQFELKQSKKKEINYEMAEGRKVSVLFFSNN